MRQFFYSCVFVGLLVVAPLADVWDIQSDSDNGVGTDNELLHGSVQLHDLGALAGPLPDEDWFLMPQAARSSYEAIIDGVSGDLAFPGLAFERMDATGTMILQTAVAATSGTLGYSRALRWANSTASTISTQFLKVSGGLCGVSCGSDDIYRLRVAETTISVARYNNIGTQVTVLFVQNPTDASISSFVYYWSAAGALVATSSITTGPKALSVLATAATTGATSGSITLAHNGPHGGLNVKAVALEPSTGFSFDTAGVYRGF